MTVVANTKVGKVRGRCRVWLEGMKLAQEGIKPGDRYNIVIAEDRVVLSVGKDGSHVVSRRAKKAGELLPVIDLNVSAMKIFTHELLLRVVIQMGRIIITPHARAVAKEKRETRIIEKVRKGTPLAVASFFHGSGGLDYALHDGFARSGVSTAVSMVVEKEDQYLDISLKNNPVWAASSKPYLYYSAIEHVGADDFYPDADIVVAGIPCVGASSAGRSKNKLACAEEHASAGAAFFWTLRLCEVLNPAIILFENVKNYMNTASMAIIRSVLTEFGYRISERVFNGVDFGALERRERMCMVAVSEGLPALDLVQVMPLDIKPETLGAILEPVAEDDPMWGRFECLVAKEERDLAAGKGFRRQLVSASDVSCGVVGRGYSKNRSTEPFIQHPSDPLLSRKFSAVEHCRIKGYPERMIDGVSETVAHEILGQGVCVGVFRAVAAFMGGWLLSAASVGVA